MDSDLVTGSTTAWLVTLVAVLLGAGVVAGMLRSRARSRRALEQVLAQTDELRREVDGLRRSARPVERTTVPYVITGVGGDSTGDSTGDGTGGSAGGGAAPATRPATGDGRIAGRLFADLVLRESVVRAAGLAHGVRRALAPEARHRIRFEMGREVKRARKQRRADLREARRRLQAEQRVGVGGPPDGPRDGGALREQGAA